MLLASLVLFGVRSGSTFLVMLLLTNIPLFYKPEEWFTGTSAASRNLELSLATAFIAVGVMLVRGDESENSPKHIEGITPKSWSAKAGKILAFAGKHEEKTH